MTETAEQQRTRILNAYPETEPSDYDLALELGYTPESWAGMWRLSPRPFTFTNGYVIIREVVSKPSGRATIVRGDRVSIRARSHRAPALTP